ncbi:unnamed protein product [Durusdinium trenchii]|uniref:Uncharacterized protein n=1 Tax=Durusdinium trenchii TaxID=1381693 RepID=A0ABP0H8P5_9DINO
MFDRPVAVPARGAGFLSLLSTHADLVRKEWPSLPENAPGKWTSCSLQQAVSSEFSFDSLKSLNEEAAKIAAGEFSISQADEADTKEELQSALQQICQCCKEQVVTFQFCGRRPESREVEATETAILFVSTGDKTAGESYWNRS